MNQREMLNIYERGGAAVSALKDATIVEDVVWKGTCFHLGLRLIRVEGSTFVTCEDRTHD